MQALPTEWTRKPWTYTQVSREGEVAIYRQHRQDAPVERFEVILVQYLATSKTLPSGKRREAGEYYPGSSQWGQQGWTFYTLADAQQWAQQLAQREVSA